MADVRGDATEDPTDVRVYADEAALAAAAAEEFARAATDAVQQHGKFAVALAGGRTPRALYELLGRNDHWRNAVPWAQTHFFWTDERCVPPTHADSNYRMAHEAMLSHVPVLAGNIHRVRGEDPDPAKAAADYEAELRAFFGACVPASPPRFDLVLLGMGADGHTASLFPGTPVLNERVAWAAAVYVPAQKSHRVTLTFPVLNAAGRIVVLVSGHEKAAALRDALREKHAINELPIRGIHPERGELIWLSDQAASTVTREAQGRDSA